MNTKTGIKNGISIQTNSSSQHELCKIAATRPIQKNPILPNHFNHYLCSCLWARPGRTKIMKIITWNCNMAFRKKASIILTHNPDILIIVECEHPDKLLYPVDTPKPTDYLWFGKNRHKGLAIF